MIAHAIALARAGTSVFPLNADKSPRTAGGFHAATTDEATILGWPWDDAMIGSPPNEGVVIIDVDPRNDGVITLGLFPALPPTRTTRTRSGGSHYWLTVDPSLKLRGKLGPGIDVKRHGKGYVVIPPSPGYVYQRGGPMAQCPQWLLDELVVEEKTGVEYSAADAKYFPFEKGTSYGLVALKNTLARLEEASNGARNDELNKAAFTLGQLAAGGELSPQHAVDGLLNMAAFIGLKDWEARNTIESGWTAGEQVPRQAPARA